MERLIFSRTDWPQVKREAGIALGVSILAALAMAISHSLHQKSAASWAETQRKLEGARGVLATVEAERRDLIANLGPYRELQKRAVIGGEQRLRWRDVLEAERQNSGLTHLSYSLQPRQPLSPRDPIASMPENLLKRYRSSMTLEMEFPRETAFVDFLENLTAKAPALAILRSCDLARPHRAGDPAPERIEADCEIDWITFERTVQRPGIGTP